MRLTPAAIRESMRRSFLAVGMTCSSAWKPSRKPTSTISTWLGSVGGECWLPALIIVIRP